VLEPAQHLQEIPAGIVLERAQRYGDTLSTRALRSRNEEAADKLAFSRLIYPQRQRAQFRAKGSPQLSSTQMMGGLAGLLGVGTIAELGLAAYNSAQGFVPVAASIAPLL
jgi:hypothetical protein